MSQSSVIPALQGNQEREKYQWSICFQVQSKLALLAAGEGKESERWGIEARIMILFWKPADTEDGSLTSQNDHLVRVWILGSFMDQTWGRGKETKWKDYLILPNIS